MKSKLTKGENKMIQITVEEFKKIHKDYKGKINGVRSVFAGCVGGSGTDLVEVEIVKAKSKQVA